MIVLKRKDFARWQAGERLSDAVLCKAVHEMESGLVDADLGGGLYKKRIARPGAGKSGGYRTLLSARVGHCYVFLYGFPKSDKGNITRDEKSIAIYRQGISRAIGQRVGKSIASRRFIGGAL